MICSFLTKGNIYKDVSNIWNNLTPYSIAVGEENIYFLTPHFKFIKKEMIDDNEMLKSTENFVNPFDYHPEKRGVDCFETLLEYNRIHSSWPEDDVNIDELEYTDGGIKIVKIFYQKRVICHERDSD